MKILVKQVNYWINLSDDLFIEIKDFVEPLHLYNKFIKEKRKDSLPDIIPNNTL